MGILLLIIIIMVFIYFYVKKIRIQKEKNIPLKKLHEEKTLADEDRQKCYDIILKISMLICDDNQEISNSIRDYLILPIDDFIKEYENLDREMDLGDLTVTHNPSGVISPEIFGVVCIRILNYYGFVSSNDLNFTLEEMLFNFKRTFDYYNISSTLFDIIENKDDLMILEHVNLVAKVLPHGWRLCNWQIDGDEYNFFILQEQQVDKVFEVLRQNSSPAYIEINLINPISGFNG